MMLPAIVKIAESYGIEINERTLNNTEVYCKCPFCHADANKSRHYLSLNTDKNVYKCWHCKKSGGVINFESELTGKPFQEIREKYFGKRKKSKHPAYNLSPKQLKQIGWQQQKRTNFNMFKQNREQVMRAWKMYEYEELVKFYALLLLIAYHPLQDNVREHKLWFKEICKESQVQDIMGKVIHAYKKGTHEKWQREGERIARYALDHSYQTNDTEFANLFVNVLFVIETLKKVNKVKKIKERGKRPV